MPFVYMCNDVPHMFVQKVSQHSVVTHKYGQVLFKSMTPTQTHNFRIALPPSKSNFFFVLNYLWHPVNWCVFLLYSRCMFCICHDRSTCAIHSSMSLSSFGVIELYPIPITFSMLCNCSLVAFLWRCFFGTQLLDGLNLGQAMVGEL